MTFRDTVCKHLAIYKADRLGVKEDGQFLYRGEVMRMAHILPTKHRKVNILEEYRSKFFGSDYARIKFHRYFHHLNSSQAMCINLFYPLIDANRLDLVTKFIGIPSTQNLKPCFEKESEVEAAVRRCTSFDFHIRYSETRELFFEVKYTELGFGKARSDEEHKRKFRDIYSPLVKRSSYLTPRCQNEQFFLDHYQVLRNLVHINEASEVVLIFPEWNIAVAKEADIAYKEMLTGVGKGKFKIVLLEKLVTFLETNQPLAPYYLKFRDKYLPSTIVGGQTMRTP